MNSARGKTRCGLWVSSAMLTESSKPTRAKNASAAPLTTRPNGLPSELNSNDLPGSPTPRRIAIAPITMMNNRPDTSTQVSTTLRRTDSDTPRKLISARTTRNATTTNSVGTSTNSVR